MKNVDREAACVLLTSPITIIPLVLGLSFLLLSAIITPFSILGLTLLGVGFCTAIFNFIFNYKSIKETAVKNMRAEDKARQRKKLDLLRRKLLDTPEKGDENSLNDLRNVYENFISDLDAGKISTSQDIYDKVNDIYEACVHSLEHSYDIWEQATKMSPALRKDMLQKRSKLLDEVQNNISLLFDAVSQVRALGIKAKISDLNRLRENLNRSLRVAKNVDEFSEGLERFSEYE